MSDPREGKESGTADDDPGAEWSPTPSDEAPNEELAFAAAVASMGEHWDSAGVVGAEDSTEDEMDTMPEASRGASAATSRAEDLASEAVIAEEDDPVDDAGLLASMLQDSQAYLENADNDKHCWVCFASEEDDPSAVWVHPCKCRGTTKWVHQACIQRWVDEKQKGNSTADVECPQCGTTYIIKFPRANLVVAVLDALDKLVQRLCPVVAGAVCVGSLYWTGVTFGAVTVMQAIGHDEGLMLMERSDPLFLLVSLPLVPVGLVLGKMVRWEEPVLKFLRRTVPNIPLSRFILPVFAAVPQRQAIQSTIPPMTDPISVTRTFCGALFFPTIATFLGSSLYPNVHGKLRRTLLGGLTFLTVKAVVKVYHKQHIYVRQCQRRIMNYTEGGESSSAANRSSS